MKSNRLIAVVCTLAVLVCVGCGGCVKAMPSTFEQSLEAVDKAAQLAKEHGVSWYATASLNGKPSIGYSQEVFFNTGADVIVHFQGNAQGDAGGSE